MKHFLLFIVSLTSIASTFAQPSLQNPNINLDDALKTQGTYEVTAVEVIRDSKGNEQKNRLTNYGTFVLMYDTTDNTLIGSFTSKKTYSPSNLVKLTMKYSDDHKSLIVSGFGGQVLYGELNLTIGINSGKVTGSFIDGVSLGRREISGTRTSSLGAFANMADAMDSNSMPMSELVGSYVGDDKYDPFCTKKSGCRVHLLMRQFSDKTITAAITFLDHAAPTFTYSGGIYNAEYALVELTWNGQILSTGMPNLNTRMRTKVNVLALKSGEIAVYMYTTTGIYSYFKLKKDLNTDVRTLRAAESL